MNNHIIMKNIGMLDDLTDSELEALMSLVHEKKISANEIIIYEHARDDDVYIIKEGAVRVEMTDEEGNVKHKIALLGAGSLIGELSALDHAPRSAEVIADTDTSILFFSLAALKQLSQTLISTQSHTSLYDKVRLNISKNIARHLRKTNVSLVSELREKMEIIRARLAIESVMAGTLIILSLYFIILNLFENYDYLKSKSTLIGAPSLFIFTLITLISMKNSGFSFSFFGFNLRHWKTVCFESILYSIPFMLIILAIKYVAIIKLSINEPLFSYSINRFATHSFQASVTLALLYLIFIPCQEMIFRGALQTTLSKFFMGKYAVTRAILLTSLLFGATHIHLGILMTLSTFFLGIFWGMLYEKQHSLLGVIISHELIAIWATYVVGLDEIIFLAH